jgi:hypothetical protein
VSYPACSSAIALLVDIARFAGESRAVTPIIGDATAAVVVAKWGKAFDAEKMRDALLWWSEVIDEISAGDDQGSQAASQNDRVRLVKRFGS